MDEVLFGKVISDLSGESGFLFLPQGFGESLLHPKWLHLISATRSLRIRPVVVLTNGMLLREDKVPPLIKGSDVVVITVDGSTAETYRSVRVNGDLSVVTGNVENFLKTRGGSATPHLIVRMIRMRDTEKEVEAFRTFWLGKVAEGDIIQVSDCIDWAGTVPYRGLAESRSEEDRHACRMLWKNLTVFHDGRVTPCCYDAEGELVVGNVLDQSLREIWNGLSLRNLRDSHLACQFNRIPLCSRCRNWH
jgi:radical SAM protein with 4Fe4S-binding SPASM domain